MILGQANPPNVWENARQAAGSAASAYRPHGEKSAVRTSVAQAFAENRDAFVLGDNPFEWEGKWPHLPADDAARLIADVIDRYTKTMKRPPRRLSSSPEGTTSAT